MYPVDRTKIGEDELKPGLTWKENERDANDRTVGPAKELDSEKTVDNKVNSAISALDVFGSVLTTPTKAQYKECIAENYNVTGVSPGFDTYNKLVEIQKTKTNTEMTCIERLDETDTEVTDNVTCLDILADVALSLQK